MKKITLLLGILLLSQTFVNAQTKMVLIEEGTGTWCNWCPRGIVIGGQMIEDYDVLFIAIHMGDVMENTPDYANATTITGLPSGNIDRAVLRSDPLNWETNVITQLNTSPPADISVSTTFDPGTRIITMTVTADFFTALSGDYRLGAVVVEDAITGTTTGYDQYNAYSGGTVVMGGWENLPDPVPARQMVYDHVARYLASDYGGDIGSLPGTIAAGSQHSHTLSWTLPADHNPEYTHVIGYITNATTGQILNAGKSAYLPGHTNAQPIFVSRGETQGLVGGNYQYDILTHDPDNSVLTITSVAIPSWLSLTTTGQTTATLTGIPTVAGIYTVTLEVTDGNSSRQQQFEIEVTDSGGVDWYLVGNQGFTSGDATDVTLKINDAGIPYVMSTSTGDQISIHTFENDTWSLLGNTVVGEQNQATMALAPDGTPYILIRNGLLKVYRFDGGSWTQVGASIGDGYHVDLAIANDGTPYVSFMDMAANYKGICKKWDGNSWITVGGSHFTSSQVAVWTKITTNSANQPVILFGTGANSNGPMNSNVVEFDGTNWQPIGAGDIDSSSATYFSHSIAMDASGKIYVGLTTDLTSKQLNVYEWDGATWTKIGNNISGGDTYGISLALDLQEKPVIGFRDEGQGGKTTVMRYDNGNWTTVGLAGFSNVASFQSLAISPNGEPFMAYQDEGNNNRATVKRYGLLLNTTNFSQNTFDMVVYPNPNSGEFTVLSSNNGVFQLTDLQGRVISEGILNPIGAQNGKFTYSFKYPNLSKGLYLLNITNEQKNKAVKIIIE